MYAEPATKYPELSAVTYAKIRRNFGNSYFVLQYDRQYEIMSRAEYTKEGHYLGEKSLDEAMTAPEFLALLQFYHYSKSFSILDMRNTLISITYPQPQSHMNPEANETPAKQMTACPECQHSEFIFRRVDNYKAHINTEGKLIKGDYITDADGEQTVTCAYCNEPFDLSDFLESDFE